MASHSSKRPASMGGIPMKQFTLVALTIQSSIQILLMHYSRIMPPVNGHRYIPSTAVFLNEIAKLTISLTMALYDIATHPKTPDTSTAAGLFGALAKAVFSGDSWKMAIPAMLFTLQNNLQYVAIGNLDAATFQVTSQLKILTTAVFSMALLGRTFNGRKWLSLFMLTVGVAIVHLPTGGSYSSVLSIKDLRDGTAFHEARNIWDLKALGNVAAGRLTKRSATYEGIDDDFGSVNPEMHASIGLTTLAVACIASSLGSVYFEKILKEPKTDHPWSIWVRNVQLSFYSLWPALFMGVLLKDGSEVSEIGFFAGYNQVVWATILLQATGGVLIAFVIKHADNIAKNFATSISVMISFLASVIFFDFEFTSAFIIGTTVVISATYLYTIASEEGTLRPPKIRLPDSEKNDQSGYFDVESIATPARSPLRTASGESALSTSRPSTPVFERLPKMKSSELRMSKREH